MTDNSNLTQCANCENSFIPKNYKDRPGRFCSGQCYSEYSTTQARQRYAENPRRCAHCEGILAYERRNDSGKFCSQRCSAIYNNLRRSKKPKIDKAARLQQQKNERFERGEITQRKTIRKHLIRCHGNQCTECNLGPIWNKKSLVLTVDHIDGNAANNMPINLRLLCPNCHSQTDTFCARNLGNGRGSRGIKKN